MIFDDGSTIDATGASTDAPAGMLPGDYYDAQKMQAFSPASDVPWWQALVAYGAMRAIDNRFGPTPVQGNTNPGSFAGQNGRSYQQGPAPRPAGNAGAAESSAGLGGVLPLALLGLLAFALVG